MTDLGLIANQTMHATNTIILAADAQKGAEAALTAFRPLKNDVWI